MCGAHSGECGRKLITPSGDKETDSEVMRNADKHSDKNVGAELSPEKSQRGLESLNLGSVQSQTEACSLEMRLEQQTERTPCFVLRDSWDQAHVTRACLALSNNCAVRTSLVEGKFLKGRAQNLIRQLRGAGSSIHLYWAQESKLRLSS